VLCDAEARAELRKLLSQPWWAFVPGLERIARDAGESERSSWLDDAKVSRELKLGSKEAADDMSRARDMERALRHLSQGRTVQRVAALGAILEAMDEDWASKAQLRRLWIRRWGLGAAPEVRLRGEALKRAIRWVADSYPSYTHAQAQRWFVRAAAAGDGDAAGWIGYAYAKRATSAARRRGDAAAAVRWRMRAVRLGVTIEALDVGFALFYGIGIRRDRRAAAAWYRRAAEDPGARSRDWLRKMDPRSAMTNLGRMYRKGEGVRKSWPLAIRWFTRAARLGSRDGAHFLAEIYSGDEGPPARPRLELSWRRIAARRGCADCRKTLGIYLWNGKRVRRNRPLALRFYEEAAKADDTWAMYLLGLAYREIDPPRRDLALSRRWLTRAAARGVKQARRAVRAKSGSR